MTLKLKSYIGAVTLSGAAVLAWTLANWQSTGHRYFLIYVLLAVLVSLLKLRLPGMPGTFSPLFLFVLIGVGHLSPAETMVGTCLAMLAQMLLFTQQRPKLVQAVFNLGNVALSVGTCFLVVRGPWEAQLGGYLPVALAVAACVYFVVNTVLVSGLLALLQGKGLKEVCSQWYAWSFPYYLVGVALVGLLPLSGRMPEPEAWLALVPVLYLVQFYYGLSERTHPDPGTGHRANSGTGFPSSAKIYISLVAAACLTIVTWAAFQWEALELERFIIYMLVGGAVSVFKVRMPKLTGNVSLNFVVLLAAIVELQLLEVALLAGTSAIVQVMWKPKVRPSTAQMIFNPTALALAACFAHQVCSTAAPYLQGSVLGMLMLATLTMYSTNTFLVVLVVSLSERNSLSNLWKRFCFWSLPYYLVGAGFAALILVAAKVTGWGVAMTPLLLMVLVYFSYRVHVGRISDAA